VLRTRSNGSSAKRPPAGGRRAGLALAAAVLVGGMVATVAPAAAQAATRPASVRPNFTHYCDTNAWRTTKALAIEEAEIAAENEGCDEILYANAVAQSEGGVPGYYATVEAIEPG
jgi:hypothetical protein